MRRTATVLVDGVVALPDRRTRRLALRGRGAAMEPSPRDVRLAKARLRTGLQLQYAERGTAGGDAIVFLPGYSDSWYSFSRLLPLLSPARHAFAVTPRGHGDSDKPASGYAPDDFAADVDAFLDAVGIDDAVLVGHSGGALFAERLALDFPWRVRRLVLLAPQTSVNEAIAELRASVRTLHDPVPLEFVREFQLSTLYQPVSAAFLETAIAESRKLPAQVWRDYMEQSLLSVDRDYLGRLREIAAPTLVLCGERDALFSREEEERFTRLIPNATLKVYPETGHALHWERPEAVVRDLEALLDGVPPRRSSAPAPGA